MTHIPDALRSRAETTPDAVAIRHKHKGIWRQITWSEHWTTVTRVRDALLAAGVRPGDRVSIQCHSRPEWLELERGALAARCAVVGVSPFAPPKDLHHILQSSGARVHLAEGQEQLDQLLDFGEPLGRLERIIYLESRGIRGRYADPRLTSWGDFLAVDRPQALPGGTHHQTTEADDLVALVYGDGADGLVGAEVTHEDVRIALASAMTVIGNQAPMGPRDSSMCLRPLSDAAERVRTSWLNVVAGTVVHFAESERTIERDLAEVEPTLIAATSSFWSALADTVRARVSAATWAKRHYGRFWIGQAHSIGARRLSNTGPEPILLRVWALIGSLLYFRALRRRVGLRRVRLATESGPPLPPDALNFLVGLGVRIQDDLVYTRFQEGRPWTSFSAR